MVLHKVRILPLIFLTCFLHSADRRFGRADDQQPAFVFQNSLGEQILQGVFANPPAASAARDAFSASQEYTYDDYVNGRPIGGVDVSTLSRDQKWDIKKLHDGYRRAADSYDLDRLALERTKVTDVLALRGISAEQRLYYTKALQLLTSESRASGVDNFRKMLSTNDPEHAKEVFKHFKALHDRKDITDDQFRTVETEYNNRPDVKELKQRILTSCDFISTDQGYTRDILGIDGLLKMRDIDIPVFTESIHWCEATQYINANMAETALMVEGRGSIEWEQWGVLNTEAIFEVIRPIIMAAGAAHGAGDAIVKPLVDAGHSLCNIVVETIQVHYGVDVDTPMHDALHEWVEGSKELCRTDPYQAGFNLGGTLMNTALPFVKGSPNHKACRVASYKKVLATCKNANKASDTFCLVM